MLPRLARITTGLLFAFLAGISALLILRWPYAQERIIARLEDATGSRVVVNRYRLDFFPEPGCTMEDLTFHRHAQQPIARADTITIRSSWWSVLTLRKRVRRLHAERLHLQIPSPFPSPVWSGRSGGLGDVIIGEFVADGAILEFVSQNRDKPTRFALHQVRLNEVSGTREIAYATELDIPDPPGRVKSSGTVGPFLRSAWGRTPVVGSFELKGASLDKYKDLAGKIDGKGTFQGQLDNICVRGSAVATAFEANRTGHPVDLRTAYTAHVNALSGDVILQNVQADFLGTRLSIDGAVQGAKDKTVSLQVRERHARVEDLLFMFTRSEPPALIGPIQLRADIDLLPGDEPFIRRLVIRGRFSIRKARFARPRTQTKVNSLSARARGDKKQVEDRLPEDVDHVLSELEGDVSLRKGVAVLSGISFRVPGATANGGGTYNLLTKRVDLTGTVSMVADVSEATSGIKSVLLKPFDGLFRRNRAKGATLRASVRGQYPRPQYRIGLRK
ncbi:MAG TPA: AsmA-like C-terminal region-containing protein [Bryobacteraceae bacterium]|nr:AsmA-like C-terminal region-containing protein [Bryobacteraceae bacterium]